MLDLWVLAWNQVVKFDPPISSQLLQMPKPPMWKMLIMLFIVPHRGCECVDAHVMYDMFRECYEDGDAENRQFATVVPKDTCSKYNRENIL